MSDAASKKRPPGASVAMRLLAPVGAMALLTAAILLWQADRPLYFQILAIWGVPALDPPLMDWRNLGAAVECWRHGVDVYRVNPCDPMGRIFPYSRLWLDVGGRLSGYLLSSLAGLLLDFAFAASLWFVGRPRGWREAALAFVAAASTASAYAVERANVDLIIFSAIVGAAGFLVGGVRSRMAGYATILLAGLLKFYPLAAFVTALREPPRRFFGIAVSAAIGLAALLIAMRSDLAALSADIPGGHYGSDAFGAANIIYLILAGSPSRLALTLVAGALVVAVVLAVVSFVRSPGLASALAELDGRDRTGLVLGAAIIVGCFFSGQSIIYRAIFLLPVIAGLQALRRAAADARFRNWLLWLTCGAILLMWEGAVHGMLFAGRRPIPGAYLLAREALWWWVVANLTGILAVFAWRSTTPEIIRFRIGGWLKLSRQSPVS